MSRPEAIVQMALRQFTVYALRIVPLWDGDAERIEIGHDLETIVATIVRDRSIAALVGGEVKPMRHCVIEGVEAICLAATQQTYYAREPVTVWKVMVPASGIYSRETIQSCLARGGGRNIEKYRNALFLHPRADRFYTTADNEIRPVDDTVFVIEHPAR